MHKQNANKKPPKPQCSAQNILPNQSLILKSQATTDKENSQDNKGSIGQAKLKKDKSETQKLKFKSNGANKGEELKRPQTVCLQSKMPSPQSDIKLPAQRPQQQIMSNTTKLKQSIDVDDDQFGPPSATIGQKSNSKYASIRNQKPQQESGGITGKRVVQPQLIVQGELSNLQSSFHRLSPQRTTNSKDAIKRKNGKKSKSQNIQANLSHNAKASSTGRVGNKPKKFLDFLDTSLTNHLGSKIKQDNVDDEKDLTLKILNQSQDHKSKSRQHSNERSKVQMKYLNFHRKNVIKSKTQCKRSATTIRENHAAVQNERGGFNKTLIASANRISRLTGSLSPQSKSVSANSRILHKDEFNAKDRSLKKKNEINLTKSAVDIPAGISTIILDRKVLHNDSELSMAANYKKHQNQSAALGHNDKSNLQLVPNKNQGSGPDVKKHKTSISPQRVQKIEKIIRDNIKKELLALESKRIQAREREASSQRRKTLLEQKNQLIRKLNHEKMQRRRLKLKDNALQCEAFQDQKGTRVLEEALLAVSDGAQQIQSQSKDKKHLSPSFVRNTQIKLKIQQNQKQYQDFAPLRTQAHQKSLSLMQQSQPEKKHMTNLTTIRNENMLGKREQIRKFMRDKAQRMQAKVESQKAEEIKTYKKVRCNLTKLNEFVQSKLQPLGYSGATTPALKVKRQIKRNNAAVQEHEAKRERQITPIRAGLFEQSDISLNISAKRGQTRSVHRNYKDQHKLHDTLYEDSRLSSIDAQEERSAVRNGVSKVLSVCFEKSASQKNLRKALRQSTSPQINLKHKGSNKRRPRSALCLHGSKSLAKRKAKHQVQKQKKQLAQSQGQAKRSYNQAQGPAEDQEMTLNLKFTDQAAATIIQKEVRKFLGVLGFYEAKQVNDHSPKLYSPQKGVIDLYIKPRSTSSKRSPPLLSNQKSKQRSTSSKQRRNKSQSEYELSDPAKLASVNIQISGSKIKELFQEQQEQSCDDSSQQHQFKKRSSEDIKLHRPINLISRPQALDSKTQKQRKPQVAELVSMHSESTPFSQQQQAEQRTPESINNQADSQSSSSLFDRNAFKNFSQAGLANLMKNNEYQKLIQFREECLAFRASKEKKIINKLFSEKQMTPRTYNKRHQQIERWVTIQREEIEQTKKGFQEEWDKTLQMIEETQRNVDLTKIKIFSSDTNSYSQASSRAKPTRQILIDEAPKSYRSGRHDPNKISEADPSPSIMTSRDSHKIDEMINKQLNSKQQSDKIEQSSKSEMKYDNEDIGISKESSTLLDQAKEFTQHHHKSSSGDYDEIQPSAAFINKLEKAVHGLTHKSADGTLNIEEHSYAEDFDPNNQFEDGNSKNRIFKLQYLNNLFAGEFQANSEAQSDHKSEPLVEEGNNDVVKISEMLKLDSNLKHELNYQDDINKDLEDNLNQVASVTKPGDSDINSQMADQFTDQIMQQIIQECLQLPQRTKQKSSPPMPIQEVFTVDQFSIEKEEKKEWIEMRQRHLIEANLIRADQYVNELVDALLQFDISDISENSEFDYEVQPSDNFHIQFLKLLTQPIQRPPIDTLTLMQKSELGSYSHFETTLDVSKHPIVSVDLYLDIEKTRERQMMSRKATADAKKLQIWESIHIYNKCIFDAVNESLMKFRPYGIVGQPMPWSNKVRRLQTKVEIASVDTERLFQMVKQEIFRWTQVFCGCLPGPVFYFPNSRTGVDEFQEDLFQEVRERRLTNVLTQDTVEQEHHWLNYEFEETQVKIDLSDMILEHLVGELIELMSK